MKSVSDGWKKNTGREPHLNTKVEPEAAITSLKHSVKSLVKERVDCHAAMSQNMVLETSALT